MHWQKKSPRLFTKWYYVVPTGHKKAIGTFFLGNWIFSSRSASDHSNCVATDHPTNRVISVCNAINTCMDDKPLGCLVTFLGHNADNLTAVKMGVNHGYCSDKWLLQETSNDNLTHIILLFHWLHKGTKQWVSSSTFLYALFLRVNFPKHLKPRGDFTRSPKQGYQWPHKRTCVHQKLKKKHL